MPRNKRHKNKITNTVENPRKDVKVICSSRQLVHTHFYVKIINVQAKLHAKIEPVQAMLKFCNIFECPQINEYSPIHPTRRNGEVFRA